jgi:hypothetical protein
VAASARAPAAANTPRFCIRRCSCESTSSSASIEGKRSSGCSDNPFITARRTQAGTFESEGGSFAAVVWGSFFQLSPASDLAVPRTLSAAERATCRGSKGRLR